MGLLNTLDRIFFSEEYLNKCKNGSQTSELKSARDIKEEFIPRFEEKEYEEGIFHVKKTFKNSYIGCIRDTLEKTVEGKVIGFAGEGDNSSELRSINRKGRNVVGTYLVIETPKETGQVIFPAEFLQDRRNKLKNQKIKYYHFHEDFEDMDDYLVTDIYKINVLDGPIKGEFFERKFSD